jgi:glutamate/tyrosine decarboxylase-like PLP-dependent enzyme
MPASESLLLDVSRRADRYLAELRTRKVTPTRDAVLALDGLGGQLAVEGTDPGWVLAQLDDLGSPATVASAGGRYFGFVIGSVLPAALAGDWLASTWDQNAAMTTMSPVSARLEAQSVEWIRDLLGLPPSARGALVTGDTMANLTCLVAARKRVLDRTGWETSRRGLVGAPPVQVILSEEAHVSVLKALTILGFGSDQFVRVPVDSQGRMRAAEVPTPSGPSIVCTQVGNVNTGSSDPVGAICEAVRDSGAWVHVDGAFGLWARASSRLRSRYAGVEMADSWATDGHKWLNVPYDCGMAFSKDSTALRRALAAPSAAYLPAGAEGEPMEFVPEMSRRARGVACWAALRSLGRSGVESLIDRTCGFARRFADRLASEGYTILNEVELNQVLISFGSNEETLRVVSAIQADGTCWMGSTVWHGKAAMRISVSSWATTESDVDASIEAILRIARGAA